MRGDAENIVSVEWQNEEDANSDRDADKEPEKPSGNHDLERESAAQNDHGYPQLREFQRRQRLEDRDEEPLPTLRAESGDQVDPAWPSGNWGDGQAGSAPGEVDFPNEQELGEDHPAQGKRDL